MESNQGLSEPVLARLTSEAVLAYSGEAAGFEARLHRGVSLVLTGEPVADLNYLVAGPDTPAARFDSLVAVCRRRALPFVAMLFPSVADELGDAARRLGLSHVAAFPFLERTDGPQSSEPGPERFVRARDAEDARASALLMETVFGLPEEAVLRSQPARLFQSPSVEVWLAELDGRRIGTLTLTFHGDVVGVWAMGVDPRVQRRGVGRRFLTSVLRAASERGARRSFLAATPAGLPLYERLGFALRFAAQVWTSEGSSDDPGDAPAHPEGRPC